jgi:hypothetical protein
MTTTGARFAQRVFTMVLSLGVLLLAGSAWAGGRVEWKTKSLKESDSHSWTIDVAIYLNSTPDVATLPMRFSFTPSVYYERALVDGKEGPQERKVPLEGKPPLVESVDVGFLDPGTGQVQKRTKFSFKVTRGHGFEAGEYDVTIKDGRTDASLGGAVHLVFDGENEVIDRRAIVFSGEKKKEKTEEKKDEEPKKKELTPDDPGYWAGGPKDEQKEEVEPKRGCGCRLAATDTRTDALGLVLAAGALAVQGARRRRGRR